MNHNEVEKHVFFQIFFIVFVFVTMAFTLFMILTDKVEAADYENNVTNAIYTGTTHCSINQTGICTSDTSSTSYSRYTFGTTSYQHTLSMNFKLNTAVRANVNATIRLTGSNFANVNYVCMSGNFSCRVVRASSSILNINFSNTGTTAITGAEFFIEANGSILNTNDTFYVQKAILYENLITTGGSSGGSSSNTDIINNQNQNTQDLINNQNENTEDIINNNNSNTQDIIHQVQDLISNDDKLQQELLESQTCPVGPLVFTSDNFVGVNNKYLNSTGQEVSDGSGVITPYLIVKPNQDYVLFYNSDVPSTYSICRYTSTKQVRNCYSYSGGGNGAITTTTFKTDSFDTYVRFSIRKSRQFRFAGPVCNDWEKEAQDIMNSILNDTNSYLKDDSNPNISDEALSDTLDLVSVDDPLGYLATLPLTLLAKINTNLETNSCTPFNLGKFGFSDYNFTLPCIQPENYLGNTIWSFLDLIISVGLLSISVYKLHHTVNNFLGMGSENEVNSYSAYWSPMEFLMIILGGEKGYSAAYDRHFGGDN